MLADFDEDGGDVVFAAALVGDLDEPLRRPLRRRDTTTDRDLFVTQVAVQAVGAEQESVPRRERSPAGVDLDVIAVAHRARDHVAMR